MTRSYTRYSSLWTLLVAAMLCSCTGPVTLPDNDKTEQEVEDKKENVDDEKQDDTPPAPPAPVTQKGHDLTVSMAQEVVYIFPAKFDEIIEVQFDIKPAVKKVKYDLNLSDKSVVKAELSLNDDNSGGVIRIKTLSDELGSLKLSLKVTEIGENIIQNWSDNCNLAIEPYVLKLSHYERETMASGTNHAEFSVKSNVGFDPIVDEEYRDWISIVAIEGEYVVVNIDRNTGDTERDGYIKVWDSGHHVYETFKIIQLLPYYDVGGIVVEMPEDGGDWHVDYGG